MRSDTTLALGNAALELVLSKETGNWLELTSRPDQIVLAHGDGPSPTMLLRVGGRRTAPQQVRNSRMVDLEGDETVGWHTRYIGHECHLRRRFSHPRCGAREGDWLLTSHYVPQAERGHDPAPVHDSLSRSRARSSCAMCALLVPGLQLGACDQQRAASDITVEAPCYATRAHVPFCEVPEGIWGGLDSRAGGDPNRVQHDVDVPGCSPGPAGVG